MGELTKTRAGLLIAFLVLVWGLCWPIYKIALNYTPQSYSLECEHYWAEFYCF